MGEGFPLAVLLLLPMVAQPNSGVARFRRWMTGAGDADRNNADFTSEFHHRDHQSALAIPGNDDHQRKTDFSASFGSKR